MEEIKLLQDQTGWETRARYRCADGAALALPRGPAEDDIRLWAVLEGGRVAHYARRPSRNAATVTLVGPRNGVACKAPPLRLCLVAVSGVLFSRDMREVVGNVSQTRTFACPNTVETLGRNAFRDCRGLARVSFAPGCRLARIGRGAFWGAGLKAFAAPSGLQEFSQGAFAWCEKLKSVALNEGLEALGKDCFRGSGIEEVRLPATLRYIEQDTFKYCKHLEEAALPEGLEALGEECFQWSGLRKITIPASVREVREKAFAGCERLAEVVFAPGSRLERVGEEAFAGVPAEVTIPAGAVAPDAPGGERK